MATIENDDIILNVPSGASLGEKLEEIDCPTISCTDLTVTGTFNGVVVSGAPVFTNSTQTLTNKSLVDNSTAIVHSADNTVKIMFTAGGTTGTTSTLLFAQTANRNYSVPEPGLDCQVVLSEGAQTLTNKSLVDNSTAIVHSTDNTVKIMFTAGGTTGTTSTLLFAQTANRNYSLPEPGLDCQLVLSEGAQTINGAKTFSNLLANTITDAGAGGVTIDKITLREDTFITPAVTIDRIQSASAATNATIAIIPKGFGGIIANIPDNLNSGGNARGGYAIDLQILRSSPTQVASGNNCGIFSGQENTCGGVYSVVCGGIQNNINAASAVVGGGTSNSVTNTASVVAGGASNTITGSNSAVCGGNTNTISSNYGFVGAGFNNTVSGQYSAIPAGTSCVASADYTFAFGNQARAVNTGALVLADSTAAAFSSTATNQFATRYSNGYLLTGGAFSLNSVSTTNTNGTATTVGAVTANIYTLSTASNNVYLFIAAIVAADAAGDTAVFKQSIRAKNVGGVMTLGTSFDNWVDADTAINTASLTWSINGTSIEVVANGVAGVTINWAGEVKQISAAL